MAAAVVEAARARGLKRSAVSGFQSRTGLGVCGSIEGRAVLVGSAKFLKANGVDAGELEAATAAVLTASHSAILVAVDGRLAGECRSRSDRALDDRGGSAPPCRRPAHRDVTGDLRATAEAVATAVGIDEVIAEVQPEEKRKVIRRLQSEGRQVVMAGDGINDAPALAEASVGIAMATGTDVAIESAGITLVGGDLMGIVSARRLSRATMRNIRQNLFLAFVCNAVGVPVQPGYCTRSRAPSARSGRARR